MKFYLITNTQLNDRDSERFGVNFFLSIGWSVIVVDISPYTNPELPRGVGVHIDNPKLKIFECFTYKEIESALSSVVEGDIAYLTIGEGYRDIRVKRLCIDKKLRIGIDRVGMLPKASRNSTLLEKLSKLYQLGFTKAIKRAFEKLYKYFFNIKSYDFLITNNYEESRKYYNDPIAKKIILAHNRDYDLFLQLEKGDSVASLSLQKEEYIVFVDQNITRHTDFIRSDDEFVDEEVYFENLNSFFNLLKSKYDLDIKVAIHPRADEQYIKLFNSVATYKNMTLELIRGAKFVIMHYSTAVNFAVLYNKPIIFFYDSEFERVGLAKSVRAFSKAFGFEAIDISSNDFDLKPSYDKDRYLEYMHKYIKQDFKNDKLFWQIFYDEYIDEVK